MVEENPADKNVNRPEGSQKNADLGDLRGVFVANHSSLTISFLIETCGEILSNT
jgi:hypothetical protein